MKVAVLGGGLCGLGAGYRLSKEGYHVTIFEKEDNIGGLASSYFVDGCYIPKTYHHIMSGDRITLGLIDELKLKDYLYWKQLKTGFLYGKKAHDFSSALSIMRFSPLSLLDRARFGVLVWRARKTKDWMHLDQVSVTDWARGNCGKGVYENLIKHIVIDKFDEPPENISSAWLMSRFGHESRSVSGRFGYLSEGGIQKIIDRLKEEILRNGGMVMPKKSVTEVIIGDSRVKGVVFGEDEEWLETDAVISTIAPPILLQIVKDFPESFKKRLGRIRYKACICVTLGLTEKMSKYYWLNIVGNYPFVGIFEHKYLNPNASPQGIMYVVKYLDTDHPDWARSEESIVQGFIERLEEIFPRIREKVIWARVFKAPYSTPVYAVGYGQYAPTLSSPIGGLYVTGISTVYPRDRYMGTALESGFRAAKAVATNLQKT